MPDTRVTHVIDWITTREGPIPIQAAANSEILDPQFYTLVAGELGTPKPDDIVVAVFVPADAHLIGELLTDKSQLVQRDTSVRIYVLGNVERPPDLPPRVSLNRIASPDSFLVNTGIMSVPMTAVFAGERRLLSVMLGLPTPGAIKDARQRASVGDYKLRVEPAPQFDMRRLVSVRGIVDAQAQAGERVQR